MSTGTRAEASGDQKVSGQQSARAKGGWCCTEMPRVGVDRLKIWSH